MTTRTMTKTEAVLAIREHCRSIVDPGFAGQITEAFGYSLADLGAEVKTRRAGADWNERSEVWTAGPSVGIYRVAVLLAERVTGERYPGSPYMGTGKSAEHASLWAAGALARHHLEGSR